MSSDLVARIGVSPYNGICNQMLHVWRAFWFAAVHDIPFSAVMVRGGGSFGSCPLARGIRDNIVEPAEFDKTVFTVSYNAWGRRTADTRRELAGMSFSGAYSISLSNAPFVYPELPWEFALFRALFDNEAYRIKITDRFSNDIRGGSVGITVRRGDFLGLPHFRHLSSDELVAIMQGIIASYAGLVRILLASDDMPWVRSVVSHASVSDYVTYVDADPCETLVALSLCDTVISNGRSFATSCYSDYERPVSESTFGQIAALLNRCYKFGTPASGGEPLPTLDRIAASVGTTKDVILQGRSSLSRFKYPETLPAFP